MRNLIMSLENLYESEDPSWQIHMRMLTKRKRSMEIAQTIDKSLKEWYSEQGKEVPVWKTRDPQWWIDYLSELGIDPRNP